MTRVSYTAGWRCAVRSVLVCTILIMSSQPSSILAALSEEDQTVRLYERVAPATVSLFTASTGLNGVTGSSGVGFGAGFILDGEGTVLTNAHVVAGATTIIATLYDGRKVAAELVGIDPQTDVAVVKLDSVKGQLATVRLGDSDGVKVGQKVLVVGSPFGLGFTLTNGIISGWGGPGIQKTGPNDGMIQTTAPINPGNSGGPVMNSHGDVIGITTAIIAGAQNIGFAIPINRAKAVLDELKTNGHVSRPWLGVTGTFPTDQVVTLFSLPMSKGWLIERVEEGSPAAEAGLQGGGLHIVVEGTPWILGGDIVLSIENKLVRSPEEFSHAIKALRVGDKVEVEFLRAGKLHHTSITLRERPIPTVTSQLHTGLPLTDTATPVRPRWRWERGANY
ncbi:MAG: S1C family serine protease [Nitrospiraceae bacterium]